MIGLLLLAQIVSIDRCKEPLITRRDGHADKSIQLTCGVTGPDGQVAICGGKPDRSGFVSVRGRWTQSFKDDTINAIAFSPDGRFIAAAGADGVVTLLEAKSGAVRARMKGHASAVLCVAIHPKSGLVASGSSDRSIRLWNPKTGAEVRTINNHSAAVNALAFSPDGSTLVSASSDRSVRIWQHAIGRLVRIVRDRDAPVLSVAFTAGGGRIAAGYEDGGIAVIEAASGRVAHSLRPLKDAVYALAGGESILAADWAGTIVEIDPKTGRVRVK